jgi:hypothetical protein
LRIDRRPAATGQLRTLGLNKCPPDSGHRNRRIKVVYK